MNDNKQFKFLINIEVRKLKNNIAGIIYKILLIIVKLIPSFKTKSHLLIIKTDEIGDYILFRNLFIYIKESQKFYNHKITLIANASWRQIYEEFDSNLFDDIIWIEKRKFNRNLKYRFSTLKAIRMLGVSEVLDCVYSRSIYMDDGIAWIAGNGNKIAMKSDKTNRGAKYNNLDKLIYDEIINAGDVSVFECVRNRNFISYLTNKNDIPLTTKISIKHDVNVPKDKYVVFFIGAGNRERKWPIPYFVETGKYLQSKYNFIPILCGGKADETDANQFCELYDGESINLTGKTSLIYLLDILSKAKLLICVDTGPLHMAIAVNCPVVGLFSGKFFERFAPYPEEITEKLLVVYPDFVDNLIKSKNPILYDTDIMKNDTIKLIPPLKVFPLIDEILKLLICFR